MGDIAMRQDIPESTDQKGTLALLLREDTFEQAEGHWSHREKQKEHNRHVSNLLLRRVTSLSLSALTDGGGIRSPRGSEVLPLEKTWTRGSSTEDVPTH